MDGAQLLKVAAEKMKEVKSLRFKMEMSIEIIADQLGSMEMIYSADGEHTADPNATHLKGNVSLFGFMESPIEEYTFVEDNKSISYEWDNDAQTFERSETELGEKEDEQQEAKEFDYSTLDAVTAKDGGEYVVTVNATMKQARVLMQLGAGVLSGSETTEMLDADDSEDEDEKDVKLPMIFRIDEASGRITGFILDLDEMLAESVAEDGEDSEDVGEMHGKLALHYSDFDSVETIEPPAEYVEAEPDDWDEEP